MARRPSREGTRPLPIQAERFMRRRLYSGSEPGNTTVEKPAEDVGWDRRREGRGTHEPFGHRDEVTEASPRGASARERLARGVELHLAPPRGREAGREVGAVLTLHELDGVREHSRAPIGVAEDPPRVRAGQHAPGSARLA